MGAPAYWDQALRHLRSRDRILRRLIPQHGGAALRPPVSAFCTLARIIISQQRSTHSAAAAWQRFSLRCAGQVTPQAVIGLAQAGGLDCLSQRKARAVAGLAHWFCTQAPARDWWYSLDDDAVIAALSRMPGVGRWTAEMFLVFHLHRPDILPLEDASLLKAISLHYFSGEPVSRFEARELAQAWAPWRTVAAWHLWRSLDPGLVCYGLP